MTLHQNRFRSVGLAGLVILAATSSLRAASAGPAIIGTSVAPPATVLQSVPQDSPTSDALRPSSEPLAEAAPTWPMLYARYLAAGTVGDCASCHAEAASADRAYAWLASQSYMAGTPYLVDPRTSCLSWLGGDMPPDGPSRYDRATREFGAWAGAGASSR
jgi:hypothetical protein